MSIATWCRMRHRKRLRKLIVAHREANVRVRAFSKQLEGAKAYHPICLGGLEDRFAGIAQAEAGLWHWYNERHCLERKLRATSVQIRHLRKYGITQPKSM